MAMSVSYTVIAGEVVSENRGGVKRDYMPDTLGSTVALLDNTQTKTDTWTYWPYGEMASRTGTNPTPFTFVGTLGYFKDQLKRLYVRARHLRVDLGQWMTVDPLWPKAQAYSYTDSAPISHSDPSGRFRIPILGNPFWPWPLPFPGKWNPIVVEIQYCPEKGPTMEIYPVYGSYCGPQTSAGAGAPKDSVDACCRDHDNCFAEFNCTAWNQVGKLECRHCTQDLCACLYAASCGWDFQCWRAKTTFMLYACNPVFGHPFRGLMDRQ